MISCLAATSMPRVGSSRISRRGCVASQRASMAFCWLPPESWPIGSLDARRSSMPSAATSFSAICALLGRRQEFAEAHARLQRERDVLAHRQLGDDAARACGPRGRTPGRAAAHRAGSSSARLCRRCGCSPESRASSANSRRASSVRPEPSRPATPRTSPWRSSMSTGLSWPRRDRSRGGEHGRRVSPAAGGGAASRIARPRATSRPTIAATSAARRQLCRRRIRRRTRRCAAP